MQKNNTFLLLKVAVFIITSNSFSPAQLLKHSKASAFSSYKGLVMAGYQGWFNAPDDGAGRGWNHYNKEKKFEPGYCKIDMWPDVSEYKKKYKTSFVQANGKAAYVFSSYDKSTTNLHFKWMKEYNIDGVFVQRFVTNLKNKPGLNHNNTVLRNAYDAAEKNGRAIAVMYDLSGCASEDISIIITDWKDLVDNIKITSRGDRQPALYHNGKPLVVLWGVGFKNRKYNLADVESVVDFLQNDKVYGGCSVMLGVPTYWRSLEKDTDSDPRLHSLLKKIDIIHPWFVGRYKEADYPTFTANIKDDITWCKTNKVDYAPVVFPGFSWHNMYPNDPMNAIPRNSGKFYWAQLTGAISLGAEMIYVAMFDEIDEGTAIFKCSSNPPVGLSNFVTFDAGIPSDYYLFLTGTANSMLKNKIPFSTEIPVR